MRIKLLPKQVTYTTPCHMYINQQDAQISVIRLYFPLDAVHVSDYTSPSSGATL